MSFARALAISLSSLLLTLSCASHGAADGGLPADGHWRADDGTVALLRERASSMGGHGLPGDIVVGIAVHARLELDGAHARVSFIGEHADDGADYEVVETAPGQLRLTATTEQRDLPNTLTLRCVSPKANPCTSLRLTGYDDTMLPDEPAITLSRGE
jgi:hypothetical protein